jgi:hypothetical protein
MRTLESMPYGERSLLLYLETCAVDYGGRVDARRINEDDFTMAKKWHKEGFIEFGRIVARCINRQGSQFVKLSEGAWSLAHQERRARAMRLWEKRTWIGTDENRAIHGNPHFSGMNSQWQKQSN